MLAFHEFNKTPNPFPEIIHSVFKKKYEFDQPLGELHTLLDTPLISEDQKYFHKTLQDWKNDRNSVFVKNFHEYVDNNPSFNRVYHKFIHEYIKPLFPNETNLVIQKTPNIRFSLPESAAIGYDPNDPTGIVGLHCDSDFGHSEYEMNFIIPITQMFDTNSIYYETTIGSRTNSIDFKNLVLNTDEFFQAYFNKLKHCNRVNTTSHTRISFDIRVIPYTKYMENLDWFKGTKFELGKYYIVL